MEGHKSGRFRVKNDHWNPHQLGVSPLHFFFDLNFEAKNFGFLGFMCVFFFRLEFDWELTFSWPVHFNQSVNQNPWSGGRLRRSSEEERLDTFGCNLRGCRHWSFRVWSGFVRSGASFQVGPFWRLPQLLHVSEGIQNKNAQVSRNSSKFQETFPANLIARCSEEALPARFSEAEDGRCRVD